MQGTKSSTYLLSRWIYLRLLGLVYLSAFSSFSTQVLGLIGSHGILPAHHFLDTLKDYFGASAYGLYPTVAWLNASDSALKLICDGGSALSLLVVFGIFTGPALVLLAIAWLSLVTIGLDFTGFQSDAMLVEATILTLFFISWNLFEPPWAVPEKFKSQRAPSPASLLLLRILIFRLIFASGAVKILSGDPTWHNLTALCYHYETQPIPTPLAWYAFQLPCWFHRLCTLGMFFIELVAPFFIFANRPLRIVGALMIMSLQAMIALTGNYTFLNFLAIVLCLPILDDQFLRHFLPARLVSKIQECEVAESKPNLKSKLATALATLLIFLVCCQGITTLTGSAFLPRPITYLLSKLEPYRIINSYGMFAVMTTKRPEIIFEGSNDGITWLAYEFPVKPGDLKHPLAWVEPHQPRLDWRLWFAAMEPPDPSNPWVISFIKRLLEGSPDVLALLAFNPFPNQAPRYIRTTVYDYHFTDFKTRQATGAWWWRDNERSYLPPLSLSDFANKTQIQLHNSP